MTTGRKKLESTKFTALDSTAWITVTAVPASTDVVVITDMIVSSDTSASKCQFRQTDGTTNELIMVFNTANDRNEIANFSQPIHLKEGYYLQCSASANSFCTVNHYQI